MLDLGSPCLPTTTYGGQPKVVTMSDSQAVAVVSQPTQQVVATTPTRTLAHRLFRNSNHAGEQSGAATSQEIAAYHATIAAHETKERAELVARMRPEHIAAAESLFKAFKSPQLETWVRENGIGSNVWAHDFLGRVWLHLTNVETERDALRQEVAALKHGARR